MDSFDPAKLGLYDENLAEGCRQAAIELGMEVKAPFQFSHNSKTHLFAAKFPGFGTRRGLVIRIMPEWSELAEWNEQWDAAHDEGYYPVYTVRLYAYERGDAEAYKQLLCGMPWQGEGPTPHWYSYCGPDDLH